MEEEISLKEILIVLWQGKYIILVVTASLIIIVLIFSFFFVTPLYVGSIWVDLSSHNIINLTDIEQLINEQDWIISALEELVDNPKQIVDKTEFSEITRQWVFIKIKSEDKDLVEKAVILVGEALFINIGNKHLENIEKNSNIIDIEIELIDQEIASFCDQYCAFIGERFNDEKSTLEFTLAQLDKIISDSYGELDLEQQKNKLESDPTYFVLIEKKKQIIEDLIEINLSTERLKQGIISEEDFTNELDFIILKDKKAELLAARLLNKIQFDRINNQSYGNISKLYLYDQYVSNNPEKANWRLNVLLAGVLGLIISTVIVFVKPYLGEVIAEIVKSDQDNK